MIVSAPDSEQEKMVVMRIQNGLLGDSSSLFVVTLFYAFAIKKRHISLNLHFLCQY